jgi:hypothetical protein
MQDAQHAINIFHDAAQHNRDDPLRQGSLLVFPNYGQLVMTGDIHGNRRNFAKLQRFCDLEHSGARHVVLHEIIHEEPDSLAAVDGSHELLLQAAEWKCRFPDQVHFLLSNHELAQVRSDEITKNGRAVTREFEAAISIAYGRRAGDVLACLYSFILSFPLAGRTANRVFLSHSLPSPRDLPSFDPAVFERSPTLQDLEDRGSAHMLVWGRYHNENTLDALMRLLDVDFFVCGHQPQETGYDILHDRMVILASEHSHGVFLALDLGKPVTLDTLVKGIRPFASLA